MTSLLTNPNLESKRKSLSPKKLKKKQQKAKKKSKKSKTRKY